MNLTAQNSLAQKAAYLRTLPAVRERCGRVFQLATEGKLEYFDYHPDRENDVTEFCTEIITRDFGRNFSQIPAHGRWSHFNARKIDRVSPLIQKWGQIDPKESCKRLLDLFVVSVLLDAGAGQDWGYTEASTGLRITRSEGLAVCSIHMFEDGFFSSDSSQPFRVDASKLADITVPAISEQMQISDSNPIVGLEGRTSLLVNLAKALKSNPDLFGEDGRPGNMIDFLESQSITDGTTKLVPLAAFWHVLIDGFNSVWPASRVQLGGVSLGDVWPCGVLKTAGAEEGDDLVPFHKLTQWMTYSLMEPIVKVLGWKIDGIEDMTGLPEYRNGGLFMDLGVLSLKPNALPVDSASGLPKAEATHPAIVEWRALTVILLDRTADNIRRKLGLTSEQFALAQVLESATWKGGREIAEIKRPQTGGPPIALESDGTVF